MLHKCYRVIKIHFLDERDWIMPGVYYEFGMRPIKFEAKLTGYGDCYIYFEKALLLQLLDGSRVHDIYEVNITKVFSKLFERITKKRLEILNLTMPEFVTLEKDNTFEEKISKKDADDWIERVKNYKKVKKGNDVI